MSEITIVQDVLDVFRAAGFEVRESKFSTPPETIIYGTADNAGILMESVLEHYGNQAEVADSSAQRVKCNVEIDAAVREARNEAQWISVDDARKPEPGVTVLLYVRTLKFGLDDDLRHFHTEGAQVEMGEYRRGESAEMSYFDCYASPISDNDWVTHWQPLPAPPAAAPAASKEGNAS